MALEYNTFSSQLVLSTIHRFEAQFIARFKGPKLKSQTFSFVRSLVRSLISNSIHIVKFEARFVARFPDLYIAQFVDRFVAAVGS